MFLQSLCHLERGGVLISYFGIDSPEIEMSLSLFSIDPWPYLEFKQPLFLWFTPKEFVMFSD